MTAAEKLVLLLGLAVLTGLPVYLLCLIESALDQGARIQDETAAHRANGEQRLRDNYVSEGL